MIKVYPVSSKSRKYCSHCDRVAVFEIWFCNEKIIQQSAAGCLCEMCTERLKNEIVRVTTLKAVNFGLMILNLLCKVNKITTSHRKGEKIPKRALDDLVKYQSKFEVMVKSGIVGRSPPSKGE